MARWVWLELMSTGCKNRERFPRHAFSKSATSFRSTKCSGLGSVRFGSVRSLSKPVQLIVLSPCPVLLTKHIHRNYTRFSRETLMARRWAKYKVEHAKSSPPQPPCRSPV